MILCVFFGCGFLFGWFASFWYFCIFVSYLGMLFVILVGLLQTSGLKRHFLLDAWRRKQLAVSLG